MTAPNPVSLFVSTIEAATLLGENVTDSEVRDLIGKQVLQGHRVGRVWAVKRSDILQLKRGRERFKNMTRDALILRAMELEEQVRR
jgi:dephospho-CoA kinase